MCCCRRAPGNLKHVPAAPTLNAIDVNAACTLCVQEPDIAGCDAMRHVLVGGEALPPALAARFQERWPAAHLHNAYGPTETTVDATGIFYCL